MKNRQKLRDGLPGQTHLTGWMLLSAGTPAGLARHFVLEMNHARSFVQARRVLEAETPDR